jgi:alpha-mannosidase
MDMFDQQIPLYETRVGNFLKRLKELFYEDKVNLDIRYRKFEGFENYEERLKDDYNQIKVGQSWGKNWQRAWFNLTGKVPPSWQGREVIAHLNLGGEGLYFNENGLPVTALSLRTLWPIAEFQRDRIPLLNPAKGNEIIDLWLEVSAAQLVGVELENDRGNIVPKSYGRYKAKIEFADLAIFRRDLWELYLDTYVLFTQMKGLPEQSIRRARCLLSINKVIDQFTGDSKSTDHLRQILKPLLTAKSGQSDLKTLAVGHAHLDTAWLWPLEETIRKCARTFAAQISLIEKYPDYIFGASQPQHYAFIKKYYPKLYQKVRDCVKKDRIEPQGGMWIEADCNLINGESMIRQIIHGKNFFREEFGVEVRNLWLPDVFGYSPAMPQILRKSGIDYFITQKLSWNQFNRFPHHTFTWRGIDGTEIITHFPPEDDYNSELNPESLIKARDNFKEGAYLDEFLTLFGIGDGGSGPNEEIIESGKRQFDMEGSPRIRFGHAQDMLDRLNVEQEKLPVWVGELYFELHRGTLTTQAFSKKMNRFLELKLRELEILFSLLPLGNYPSEQFDTIWKKVLLYQFHDILPGSSITPVYEDSHRVYKELVQETDSLIQKVGALLVNKDENKLTLFNTLSFKYTRPICVPGGLSNNHVKSANGDIIPIQCENDNLIIQLDIPPLSAVTLYKAKKIQTTVRSEIDKKYILENELIRYEFEEDGTISRIFDKETVQEVLTEKGKGNLFGYYEDRPNDWDAWDIDIFYEKQLIAHPKLIKRKWLVDGPVRQGFIQELEVGNSKISQRIYLAFNSKRIDFDTRVDWKEDHKMLRVSFEVNIHSDTASYEIQYGHVRRNTHRNTSWDMAKFEVVGHRFADLSDKKYGVALLNDCKYGYKIHDNIIDLNLLRSPTLPDPKADRGEHSFTYSLLPHTGEMIDSDVLSEAAQLNQPPAIFQGELQNEIEFPVTISPEHVVLEVLKKAEREEALIVRIYEPFGKTVDVNLGISADIVEIHETSLMESSEKKLEINKGMIPLTFTPFKIKTLKFIIR